MKENVFLNGKFIAPEGAKLSVLSPGYLYGWGLFETMRAYKNNIVYFKQHMERILKSSKAIHIRPIYSAEKLRKIIRKAVEINGFLDAYVKLVLSKSDAGCDTLVLVKKYTPPPPEEYKRGWRACICALRQNDSSFLAQHKSNNYLLFQLAYLGARKRKFDEALILNNRGNLTEASRANIFLVKDDTLFTPSLSCGCLKGITREVIFDLAREDNLKVNEGNLTISDLYSADEVFLTNSLIGVMPLATVEDKPVGLGVENYKLTRFFMKKYDSLLKNAA